MEKENQLKVLKEGKHIRLVESNGWEFAERLNISGIVSIVAMTNDCEIVLVEQFRPPVNKRVIELPAGLAGDMPHYNQEDLISAAKRELLEETGYLAEKMSYLTEGPPSGGIVSEIVTYFKAINLSKVGSGGGDISEDIRVHEIALESVDSWLNTKLHQGLLIDPKVYLGLYFANKEQFVLKS